MKNIHILPTDKPSRLYKHNELGLQLLAPVSHEVGQYNGSNQNIYITNDEKIKENDWVLFTFNDITEIVRVTTINNNAFETKQGFGYGLEYCKKIILTTDQDLIKDGVQPIDDTFLEWFVKNPSCEEVEIEEVYPLICCIQKEGKTKMNNGCMERNRCLNYKIIIPKEEPKHETLEEAAEREYPTEGEDSIYCDLGIVQQYAFKAGAKWQAEQDNKELAMWKLAVERQEARCKALHGVISDTWCYF